MISITDINGNTEAIIGYRNLIRNRNVSGEKSLAFLILPTSQNAHSFPMVQEESIVEFDGETYRIKQLAEKPVGKTYYKEVIAIHTFFDLIDAHEYTMQSGSMTFQSALQFALGGTVYTWSIVDPFLAQDWENFGDDNRLALFQSVVQRYGAEFTLVGTHLTFRTKIGNASDYQFRYSYNVKTLARDVNTKNLATYIKGYGKQNEDGTYVVETEYTSPNASIFGIRHAKPVRDERYTTIDGLNARLQAEIIDEPEISITIDFADMRRAGFPYDVPNEGDDVFLIYEPMGIDVEARIMDISEEYTEASDLPIKTSVTLANFRNNVLDTFVGFSQTQKAVNNAIDPSGKIRYNVLDEAVKRATEALQSAQTELEFDNGIIARAKTNPNHLVLLNSSGVGISSDGGQTFREAITADGFVLSAGAIGQLSANNIQIGADTVYETGYNPSVINQRVTDLNTYVDGAFADGVITESEILAIKTHIENLNNEKADIDQTYVMIVDVPELVGTAERVNLNDAKTGFNTAHTNLLNKINAVITAGTVSEINRTEITDLFTAYRTAIMVFKETYEQATKQIAQIKADNAANGVRDDLRMSAPLPTSLTLNQDGITASTSDPNKYARLDYRGLYAKQGAIAIERPDGYLSVNNGIMQFEFAVQGAEPYYKDQNVSINEEGYFNTTISDYNARCNIYRFKHTSRYLVFELAHKMAASAATTSGGIYITDTDFNTLGAVAFTNAQNVGGVHGYSQIKVDLGVPTGEVHSVYLLLKTTNAAYPAYCLVLGKWLEG